MNTPPIASIAALMALLLVMAACDSASREPSTAPNTAAVTDETPPQPETAPPAMTIEEAAAALSEPDPDPEALSAMLDHLNIGVYAADGTAVFSGAETSPEDLWLIEELVPGLAASHSRPGPTFGEYARALPGTLGEGVTPEDLGAVYRNMIAFIPEHPMSRLLTALGTEFDADTELTQFEAWLLMVVWAPGHASPDSAIDGPLLVMTGDLITVEGTRCDEIGGDGSEPGFSLGETYTKAAADQAVGDIAGQLAEGALDSSAVTTAGKVFKGFTTAMGHLNKLLDMAKAGQIVANIEVRFSAFADRVHRVHASGRTPGNQSVQLTATVVFEGVTSATEFGCNFVGMLGLPPAGTPIENAQIEVTIDETLTEHGFIRRPDDDPALQGHTGADGKYRVDYATKEEETDNPEALGDALIREVSGEATATFSVMAATGQLLNPFAGVELLADILGLNERKVEITVEFHDPAVILTEVRDMTPWDGSWVLTLQTCNGSEWSGAIEGNASMTVQGATLNMTIDSDIEFVMPPGSNRAEVPILIDTDFSTQVGEVTGINQITQTGTLTLELSRTGVASVQLDVEEGTQDITVTGGGVSATQFGATEAYNTTMNIPIEPASCE